MIARDYTHQVHRNLEQGIIKYHINVVWNKNRHQPNSPVSAVPKKDIVMLFPYLGLQSNQVAKRLKSYVYKFYSTYRINNVSTYRINNLSRRKSS